MKGKVFIGWSGDTKIADEVKKKLEEAGFEGVVGGESRASKTLYLGEAILKEIDHCTQAIFIIQKKEDGHISSSEMFEFGYALSRLRANRIHVFYVDISENDESIPADIKGIWANYLYRIDEDKIDEKVRDLFLENQKMGYIGNKMEIINSYYEYRRDFKEYDAAPFCSEFELALYVLFFSQAAYMFNDENEWLICLRNLINQLENPIKELEQSLRFANAYLSIFINISSNGEDLYLEKARFKDVKNTFESVLNNVDDMQENEVTIWIKILALEAMNYIYILRSMDPDVNGERKNGILQTSMGYAFRCLDECKKIGNTRDDEQCVTLYKAYMYRNLYTAYINLTAPDEEKAKEYLKLSYDERKKLLEYYKFRPTNSRIYLNCEMEFFLAVSELLGYSESSEEYNENIDSCNDYLEKTRKLNLERTHFINRIEKNLRAAEERMNKQ